MKVILMQEVKGKGGEGDVIEVARGYAVNYLFPRKLAVDATSGNLKQLEQRRHNIRTREEARLGDARSLSEKLEGRTVTIAAKVGDEGRLYGSVTSQMIEDAIATQLDVDVDRRKMDVHGHIKTVGEHPVRVQVYRDVHAEVIVNVVPEGTEIPAVASVAVAEAPVAAQETAEEALAIDDDAKSEADTMADAQVAESEAVEDDVVTEADDSVE